MTADKDLLARLENRYADAADAAHEAELARIAARDELVRNAPEGYEGAKARVCRRTWWRLTPGAAAKVAELKSSLIEAGEAEKVSALQALRVGREAR